MVNVNVNELAFDRSENINPHLVRFLYSPINLICMHILTLFISTICEKWYEISECIMNGWDCAELFCPVWGTI